MVIPRFVIFYSFCLSEVNIYLKYIFNLLTFHCLQAIYSPVGGFFKNDKSQTSYGISWKLNVVQDLDLPYRKVKGEIVKIMNKDVVYIVFDGIDKVEFTVCVKSHPKYFL